MTELEERLKKTSLLAHARGVGIKSIRVKNDQLTELTDILWRGQADKEPLHVDLSDDVVVLLSPESRRLIVKMEVWTFEAQATLTDLYGKYDIYTFEPELTPYVLDRLLKK